MVKGIAASKGYAVGKVFIKKDTKNMYKMIEKEKIKGIRVFLLTE